nr:MAG TPA: hypothetical protein [Crassvirales sp.]
MNIKKLFEKTSTGLKEFVAKVDFANVIGLSDELAKYVKINSNDYITEINPDINFDGDIPVINFIYGDGSSKDIYLSLASKEFPGLMSTTDKNKIDNYVGTRLNIPDSITYVNPELQKEYTSIGYRGIKYTNGVYTFNVSNDGIDIKNDNIKINEIEISYTRGSNSTTLNQTGLIVDDTSTDSADNSTNRITITSNTIKYKYFKDNSMTDEENESGDYTYNLPKANGRLLVDSENEANPIFVNNDKTKTLTIGYNGIDYSYNESSNITHRTYIYDNIAKFSYNSKASRVNISSTVTYNGFEIKRQSPSGSSSTNYRANNITRDNFTYTFPDKSGTIELVDEEKDNKLKHIALVDGLHNIKYCNFASSFKSFEELAEYVNNNKGKITEAYTIINDETNIRCVSLGTDGALLFAQFGLDGFFINYGKLVDNDNSTIRKTLGFNNEAAIFPSNLKLITDSDETYFLNLERCIELGIVAKDNTTV